MAHGASTACHSCSCWCPTSHAPAPSAQRSTSATPLPCPVQLPDAQATSSASKAHRAHALRAAINTPIQGSAADVAMAAMLRIDNDPELRELGYRLLLQVWAAVVGCFSVRGVFVCDGGSGRGRAWWGGVLDGRAGGPLRLHVGWRAAWRSWAAAALFGRGAASSVRCAYQEYLFQGLATQLTNQFAPCFNN